VTFFMSDMPARPVTTVQKIASAMTILISLMKPSPNGFMSTAIAGQKWPSAMATTIAARTCTAVSGPPVGHNDLPLMDVVSPPVTTVRIEHREMGRIAARMLAEKI
jgi:Periplasmic binding protein-like domain